MRDGSRIIRFETKIKEDNDLGSNSMRDGSRIIRFETHSIFST